MKLVIGLGNPGDKYKNNRHNVGFMVLDKLVQEMELDNWQSVKKLHSLIINYRSEIILVKPQTFMNNSGIAVRKIVAQYKVTTPNIWVIHDDLDLALGDYKIQIGKGPKVHNGVNSIYKRLGKKNFWHVRIGIDNRETDNRISGEGYVLQDFKLHEQHIIKQVIEKVTDDIGKLLN